MTPDIVKTQSIEFAKAHMNVLLANYEDEFDLHEDLADHIDNFFTDLEKKIEDFFDE